MPAAHWHRSVTGAATAAKTSFLAINRGHCNQPTEPSGSPPSHRAPRDRSAPRGHKDRWELKMKGGQLCVATHNWVLAGR